MRDIIHFAIESAMRVEEITLFRWVDLNEEDRTIIIRNRKHPRQKHGNDQEVPLFGKTYEIILRQPRPVDLTAVKTRREHIGPHVAASEIGTALNPSMASDAPAAIAIALNRDVYNDLFAVFESCNRAHENNGGATTHGRLDISNLLGMLAEDGAMTNTRSRSWEGANLQQVLESHVYCF